jgi:uncharacterized protein YecT (DUF1311 family)
VLLGATEPGGTRLAPCAQPGSAAELIACAREGMHRSESNRIVLFRTIAARLGSADRLRLETAERAWLAYRDAACAAEAARQPAGAPARLLRVACLEQLSEERIGELGRAYPDVLAAD